MKKLIALLILAIAPGLALAVNNIESIDYSLLPGDRVQIAIKTSEPVTTPPLSFAINNPARIAMDLPDSTSSIPKQGVAVGVGGVDKVKVVSHKGRSRIVVSMTESLEYETQVQENIIYLNLSPSKIGQNSVNRTSVIGSVDKGEDEAQITNLDFRRNEKGEGQLIIELSDSSTAINVFEEGNRVIADFIGATIPDDQIQRLDVLDFATPAKYIDITRQNDNVRIILTPSNDSYEHLAYQSDSTFVLEVKALSKEEQERINQEKFGFTGERLSLNFQRIEVRSVLQLIADFTGLNVVVSDEVSGELTLRLKNVPWDQALDIILKTKGLDKRKSGNVLLIAPAADIAERERLALEALRQANELAPLRSEFFRINYAQAEDIANLISGRGRVRSETGRSRDTEDREADEASRENYALTSRGSALADARTNTLLVTDTAQSLDNIRTLIERLDVPVQQVLIESRIVIANDNFNKQLGARFGITQTNLNSGVITSGDQSATTNILNQETITAERLNFNAPIAGNGGSAAVVLGTLPNGNLLELELSALQAEAEGEVISTPRVVTTNQQEATILQGIEIPFTTISNTNGTNQVDVEFRDADLRMVATPQITPDGNVVLDLNIQQDTVGQFINGQPSIDTRRLETQVTVRNGETIVLGGVFVHTTNDTVNKVPFFGDLPLLGRFFRNEVKTNNKQELLIFVTPKILQNNLDL